MIAQFSRMREIAINEKQLGAAGAMEKCIGQAMGLFSDKAPTTPAEKMQTNELLRVIEKENPAAAAEMRKSMGALVTLKSPSSEDH